MRTLRIGSYGDDVAQWQNFLRGRDYYLYKVDKTFGKQTALATKKFQSDYGLKDDGVVGNKTYGQAMLLGFGAAEDDDPSKLGPNWPPRPSDLKPLNSQERAQLFEPFKYTSAPTSGNPEGIRILGDWISKNIEKVHIPQLKRVDYAPANGTIFWHSKGAEQVKQLFQAWDDAGLMDRVLTWGGSWNPRFIRGSRSILSNHAYASAFDINVPWNMLGHEPARVGKKGSVRELVEIANEHGFFWGGHFSRKDGMHFEIAKLI